MLIYDSKDPVYHRHSKRFLNNRAVRSWKRPLLGLVFLAAVLNEPLYAETERNGSGATVVLLERGSSSDKAGIQRDDILMSWVQNGKRHVIRSPVDLAEVEREWGPRGTVVLTGERAGKTLNFALKSVPWGFHASPNSVDLSQVMKQVLLLAESEPIVDVEAYCCAACAALSASSRPWAYLEAARLISLSDRRKDADEFFALAIFHTAAQVALQRALFEYEWGEACRQRADWRAAKDHYTVALTDRQRANPYSLSLGLDFYNLALVEFRLGDTAAAEQLAIRALHLRRKLSPRSLDVVKTLNYLGVFSLQSGDLDSADDYLQQSLALAEQLDPMGREMTFALNNLGASAERRGEMARAEQYYSRDLDISRQRNPDDYLLSYSLGNLGTIAFERGNLQRAKSYYSKALELQEKRGTGKDLGVTLNNLAAVSAEADDFPQAERLLRQALAIQEIAVPQSADLAQTIDTLGTLLRETGRLSEATQVLERALILRQNLSAGSLDVAETLHHLGETLRDQRDPVTAEDRFSSAVQIRQMLAPASAAYADSLAALAQSARSRGDLDLAEADFEKALSVLDAQEARLVGAMESRIHFGTKFSSYYSDYISLLMKRGEPSRAFETLERSKARTLLYGMQSQEIHVTKAIPVKLISRQKRIQVRIAGAVDERVRAAANKESDTKVKALDQRIDELKSERERVLSEITVANPRYGFLAPSRPLGTVEIQQLLDPETLLLEYSLNNSGSFAFAITRSNIEFYSLPATDVISRLIQHVYTGISTPPQHRLRNINEDSAALSRMILGPVASLLRRYTRIVIAGDKALDYVAFASLPPPDPSADEPFLMSRHEILEVPSVSFLAMIRRSSPSKPTGQLNRVAIIADPVYATDDPRVRRAPRAIGERRDQSRITHNADLPQSLEDEARDRQAVWSRLPRLVYSSAEAAAIVKAVGQGQSFTALNFAANRMVANSPQVLRSRIIHYATHAFFDAQQPDFTGLVFSAVDEEGQPRPGFWGTDEVFNSSINAELVVLSACETALGQHWEDEGSVGLTRAFLYAGAKNVVASLWRIDDAGTAELMRLFYQAMLRGRRPTAGALRWAQLELVKEERWSDPYYWAGFIVQGDWKTKIYPESEPGLH